MLLILMMVPVIILVILAIYIAGVYNRLVSFKNRSEASWHQIDVQLTRRADLVGNLVETVKGYAAHEKSVFEDVAAARSGVMQSKKPSEAGPALSNLDSALTRLFAVAENYPNLKADSSFLNLQSQLQEIENSLANTRQVYNETVRRYNTACESFPANTFASSFGFAIRDYFEAAPGRIEPPKVNFS
jgi:LemA protein